MGIPLDIWFIYVVKKFYEVFITSGEVAVIRRVLPYKLRPHEIDVFSKQEELVEEIRQRG